ncbi:uncharacterized protein [Triticum aestivum]|uniref:uncharacterized protein n=1 Tax=Triticum aestivum TaxID=4565 RepID=UPI001D008A02|nr:uncharacterized protein LOC123124875 [Triticum aestivum]
MYHFELDERQYLDSLCSKIQKFVDLSSLTKDWSLLKFATALKFLVYPRQSYEVWKPSKILSASEYMSIKSMRRQYRETIMSEFDVLSLYKDVIALYEKRLEILSDINILLPVRPKKIKLWNSRFLRKLGSTDSPAGSKVGKEAIIGDDTDAKQTSAAQSMGEAEEKDGIEESGAKGVKAAQNLEIFEPPQTADASNETTAQPTQETSGNGMKTVDSAGESRQNGQVFPLRGTKSKELNFPETEPDVTCDKQAGDTDTKQTSTTQIMGESEKKNSIEDSGAKAVKAAESLADVMQPQTDGANLQMTAPQDPNETQAVQTEESAGVKISAPPDPNEMLMCLCICRCNIL